MRELRFALPQGEPVRAAAAALSRKLERARVLLHIRSMRARSFSLLFLSWFTLTLGHGRAQDFTAADPVWTSQEDAPDVLPALKHRITIRPDEPTRALAVHAYVHVRQVIDPLGRVLGKRTNSTEPGLLRDLTWEAAWKPAMREGKAVPSQTDYFLIFNPKGTVDREGRGDGGPRLIDIVSPEVPEDLEKTSVLTVSATVDAQGRVSSVVYPADTPQTFRIPASAALEKWKFHPARKSGQPVDSTVELSLLFVPSPDVKLQSLDQQPKVTRQRPPVYPFGMRLGGFNGEVLVEFVIGVEGRVREAYAARSSHPSFDESAVEAVLAWRFEPGKVNGVPVNTKMSVPIVFQIQGGGVNPFTLSGSKKSLAKLPPEFQYDVGPVPKSVAVAVYPFDALRDKRGGKVVAAFVIEPSGRVSNVQAVESPGAEFAEAVRAMLDAFVFQPAMKEGKPSPALARIEVNFSRNASNDTDAPVSASTLRLLRLIEKQADEIATASKFDVAPKPISRRPPIPPSNLPPDQRKGEALVEFYIDKYGIVQLPRVVNASDPAFGYSAVQAIATWRFKPARRAGKPVDCRVRVPIAFE